MIHKSSVQVAQTTGFYQGPHCYIRPDVHHFSVTQSAALIPS